MPVNILPCTSCGAQVLDCNNISPTDLYSLQSDNFPFVGNCPQGFSCTGTNELRMICCGQELVASYPPGATAAQRLTVVSKLWNQCAVLLDFCAALPPSGDRTKRNPPDNPPGHENPPDQPPEKTQLFYSKGQTCTKICPDGSQYAYTTPAGTYLAETQASADSQAFNFACQQANLHVCPPCRTIALESLPSSLCLSNAYSLNVVATGDTVARPPATNNWSLTGSLPPGMVFHGGDIAGNALLDGTPTVAGSYTFTVTIQVSQNCSKSKTYTIVVRGITTSSQLNDASPNAGYSQTLAATGFTGTLAWSIASGSLPTGLSLNSATGEISGLPTAIGDFTVTISVTNGSSTCTKVFTLACFSYSGKRINAWKKWCGFTDLRYTYSANSCGGATNPCPELPTPPACNKKWLTMTVQQVWDNSYLHDNPGPGLVPGVDDTYVYRFPRLNCDPTPQCPAGYCVTESHRGQWIGDSYTQALNCTAPGCGICATGCGIPCGGSSNPACQPFDWHVISLTESSFHVGIKFQVHLSEAIFEGTWLITLSDPYEAKDVQNDLIALWGQVSPDDYAWEDGVFDIDVTYRATDQKVVQYCVTQPAVRLPIKKIKNIFASQHCNVNGVDGQPLTPPLLSSDPYYDYLGGFLFSWLPTACVNLVKTIIRYKGDYCIRDWPKPVPVSNDPGSCNPDNNWLSETCLNDYSTSLLPITVLPIVGGGPFTYGTGFRRILLDCALQNYWKMEDINFPPANQIDSVNGVGLQANIVGAGNISQVAGKIGLGIQFDAPVTGDIQSLASAQIAGLAYRQAGLSVCGWFKWTTAPVYNDKLLFDIELDGSTQRIVIQFFENFAGAYMDDGMVAGFVSTPFIPVINTWNFFCVTYDRITKNASIRMNNGATVVGTSPFDITAGANGQFTISFACGDLIIPSAVVVDEVGIWQSTLCSSATDFLWNSGVGRTYQF